LNLSQFAALEQAGISKTPQASIRGQLQASAAMRGRPTAAQALFNAKGYAFDPAKGGFDPAKGGKGARRWLGL
jgi:hypothetical protein